MSTHLNLLDMAKFADSLPPNFDLKKAKIERRLRWAGIEKVIVNKDLTVDIPNVEKLYLSSLIKAARFGFARNPDDPIAVRIGRVRAFDAGQIPIETFDMFPREVREDIVMANVKSMSGFHKVVKHIGGKLIIGGAVPALPLPTHLLSLAYVTGPFLLRTDSGKLNDVFNERGLEDILVLQDRLIEAGFEPQARL